MKNAFRKVRVKQNKTIKTFKKSDAMSETMSASPKLSAVQQKLLFWSENLF